MTQEPENKDVLQGLDSDQNETQSNDNSSDTQVNEPVEQEPSANEPVTETPPAEPEPEPAQQMGTPPPPPPPVGDTSGDAAVAEDKNFGIFYSKISKEMKEHLESQPKVSFMVPRDPLESESLSYESVQINGYRMEVKKGVMVQLPQQVAELLANKYQVELNAGSDMRIDRQDQVRDALTR